MLVKVKAAPEAAEEADCGPLAAAPPTAGLVPKVNFPGGPAPAPAAAVAGPLLKPPADGALPGAAAKGFAASTLGPMKPVPKGLGGPLIDVGPPIFDSRAGPAGCSPPAGWAVAGTAAAGAAAGAASPAAAGPCCRVGPFRIPGMLGPGVSPPFVTDVKSAAVTCDGCCGCRPLAACPSRLFAALMADADGWWVPAGAAVRSAG